MVEGMINSKYYIADTLFLNEIQSIYLAKSISQDNSSIYIINGFKDKTIIDKLSEIFINDNNISLENIEEVFLDKEVLYIVSVLRPGSTIKTFSQKNILNNSDKIKLTESILLKLSAFEKLPPYLQYLLCDYKNISIVDLGNISINHFFHIDKESLSIKNSDVIEKVGSIIEAVFKNNDNKLGIYQNQPMPSIIETIIHNCKTKQYSTLSDLYTDVNRADHRKDSILNLEIQDLGEKRNSLLQGRKKIIITSAIAVSLLGGSAVYANKYLSASSFLNAAKGKNDLDNNKNSSENTKPQLAANKEVVYVGDDVTFVDKTKSTNEEEKSKKYLWSIIKDDKQIISSVGDNLNYKFLQEGIYTVSLIISKADNKPSSTYTLNINVLSKAEKQTSSGNIGSSATINISENNALNNGEIYK